MFKLRRGLPWSTDRSAGADGDRVSDGLIFFPFGRETTPQDGFVLELLDPPDAS